MTANNAMKGCIAPMPTPQQHALCLDTSLVTLGAELEDSTSAIDAAIDLLISTGHVTPGYREDVHRREQETTSYIGNHVAIPHGLDPTRSHVVNSGFSLVQVPGGVRFGAETAYLVIGIAGKNDEHLTMLAQLATVLVDDEKVESLRRANDVHAINAVLSGAGAL